MNYEEIKKQCKKGYTGMIPGWKGYLNWNHSIDKIEFKNFDYTMTQEELDNLIKDRTDLYYII